ncbi:heat shock 70 kDa protein 12A-like isoform X1 [Mytilus californianus]|uniref:heat shock 70 kDa protein 12A-like isoform X1 n=1 Tax=Mytilus californianus TaxID=6549 RepID=UPI002246611F|nr:heat shock 70 kDa protein 12A-like isoform X1 [Mytilus californianus]
MAHMNSAPQCVVAIDIGSDGCGYAFSMDYQFKTNPSDVHVPRWSPSTGSMTSLKAPSAILFDSDKTFSAFGYDAQDRMDEILNSGDQNNWYYVERFKMALYTAVEEGEDVRMDFLIQEKGSKEISAKLLFSSCIKYLKEHFRKTIDERQIGVREDKIKWIITVPAIWNDSCKQFMRESATEAGIPGDQCTLVFEPEAASVCARFLQVEKTENEQHTIILKTFQPGTKILVVDAGGGTVDISAQEVLPDNCLNIIHKVRGGDYGGNSVNMAYRSMLVRLFSGPCILAFKKNHPIDYMDMMRSFEGKKKTFKPSDTKVSSRIAATLLEISEDNCQSSFEDIASNSQYTGGVHVKRDKLFIDVNIFLAFFKHSLSKLVKDINEILQHERCQDVRAIMLVGGYADCELLFNAVKQAFPDKNVFVPHEGSLSVLTGAVIYGHIPKIVSSRVCNFTYGIALYIPFEPGMPQHKMFRYDGQLWCNDVFMISYKIDTVVNVGDTKRINVGKTFLTPEVQHLRKEPLTIPVYISDKENPKYVTDQGCIKHCVFKIPPVKGEWPEVLEGHIDFEIAGTEMIGTFVDKDTGDIITSVKIEFLPKTENNPSDDHRRRIYDPEMGHSDYDIQ